ncbi:sugar phosphate isomerase/epimerase family protein [Ohessyouella blattaphilus]|uniref:Sugar phosphate isomerase/epimerase n=1 Tax=Ohessyouella blattaphilus TaxID=2949333 RepID=A0ABT1EKC7_9FIRM|nr:sugar phosphate isomerase/epimerase family protein [Ohessyouella blattaphilus]MCP1111150.1 sugar phosphate isomerase/epimerase [Ohessyouella blattaphilus]MCR8564544.1 sugar phosphate isomerase/epimerase [Ohessyouella blattaphilus]
MKLGGFGKIADYKYIARAGFDYAELDIPEIVELSDADFDGLRNEIEECGVKVQVGSRLLPIAEPLFFKEGFSITDHTAYLRKASERTSVLGIDKVILGNGKARSLLREEDQNREAIFIDALRVMTEIAAEFNQEFILEPLGPKYSNYINTIPEAVDMISKISRPNFFTMADLRHMVWSKESFDNLREYASYLHHIHIDYPLSYPERGYPALEDDYNYDEFLFALYKSGYNGTLTVEADTPKDWARAYEQLLVLMGSVKIDNA